MTVPLIRLHQLDFSYPADGERPVLTQCDFQLDPGQRIALLGSNGSGKTTLLHLIVGLLRPGGGRIEAFGQIRRDESDFHEVRRRAGLLFQEPDDQLFCPTVIEDVAFGPMNLGKTRPEARQIVAEVLDSLGLAGYEHRITHQLSGGERRLVALAGVLAMRPDVLLLDEPTGGLDEKTAERLARILAKLPQAMVIVSHNRDFRQRIATQTQELQEGRIRPWQSG